jgi:hypothetical protein
MASSVYRCMRRCFLQAELYHCSEPGESNDHCSCVQQCSCVQREQKRCIPGNHSRTFGTCFDLGSYNVSRMSTDRWCFILTFFMHKGFLPLPQSGRLSELLNRSMCPMTPEFSPWLRRYPLVDLVRSQTFQVCFLRTWSILLMMRPVVPTKKQTAEKMMGRSQWNELVKRAPSIGLPTRAPTEKTVNARPIRRL